MSIRIFLAKVFRRLAQIIDPAGAIPGAGRSHRTCSLCGFNGQFQAAGLVPRPNARCPNCQSLERHRLLKLMLDRSTILPPDCRLLHFAPEVAITDFVRPFCKEYITTDFLRNDVDLKLNIEALDIDDCSFDSLICSHVLEHVDDVKALDELFRILKPGGLAILVVPITEGWDTTYENPAITSQADRLVHFGQEDHVRRYGRDFRDRIRRAGFKLEEFVLNGADSIAFSVIPGERVFLAQKPLATDA